MSPGVKSSAFSVRKSSLLVRGIFYGRSNAPPGTSPPFPLSVPFRVPLGPDRVSEGHGEGAHRQQGANIETAG